MWVRKILDNFTGTFGDHIYNHTPDDGWPWAVEDSGGYDIGVSGTFLTSTGANDNIAHNTAPMGNDQYGEITTDSTDTTSYRGVCVRLTGAGGTLAGYVGYIRPTDGAYSIDKITAGSRSTLVSGTASAGATDPIKFSAEGTTLTLYVNGTQIAQTTDSTSAGGMVGIFTFQSGAFPTKFEAFDQYVTMRPGPRRRGGWSVSSPGGFF